jgi:hypothetical protein
VSRAEAPASAFAGATSKPAKRLAAGPAARLPTAQKPRWCSASEMLGINVARTARPAASPVKAMFHPPTNVEKTLDTAGLAARATSTVESALATRYNSCCLGDHS